MFKNKLLSGFIVATMVLILSGCSDQTESKSQYIEVNSSQEVIFIEEPIEVEAKDSDQVILVPVVDEAIVAEVPEIADIIEPSDEITNVVVQATEVVEEVIKPETIDTVHIIVIGPEETGVLYEGDQTLHMGDSVFDVLLAVHKAELIVLDYNGSGKLAYIQGINNIYEFDYGANSGWLYSVNDEFPSFGVGNYFPIFEDQISIEYTMDGGFDIGRR